MHAQHRNGALHAWLRAARARIGNQATLAARRLLGAAAVTLALGGGDGFAQSPYFAHGGYAAPAAYSGGHYPIAPASYVNSAAYAPAPISAHVASQPCPTCPPHYGSPGQPAYPYYGSPSYGAPGYGTPNYGPPGAVPQQPTPMQGGQGAAPSTTQDGAGQQDPAQSLTTPTDASTANLPDFTSLSSATGAAASPGSVAPSMIGDNFGPTSISALRLGPETPVYGIYHNARGNFAGHSSSSTPTSFSYSGPSSTSQLPNISVGAATGGFIPFDQSGDGYAGTFQNLADPGIDTAQAVASQFSGPGVAVFRGGQAVLIYDSPGGPISATPQSIVTTNSLLLSSEAHGIADSADLYQLQYLYDYSPVWMNLVIPNPGSDAVLGRSKIAENGSPMPRDRWFVNYSLFDNVPLIAGGLTVQRAAPGFEKTFWLHNSLWSFEFRMPYANTLNSDITAATNGEIAGLTSINAVEFGNLNMALKKLIYCGPCGALSAGVQWTAPTADGISVTLQDGTRLLEVDNESWHVMPFLGMLFTPNERMFFQAFAQLDFDATGNPIRVNPLTNGNGGLVSAGEYKDPTLLYIDLSIGYWMYKCDPCYSRGGITGVAPMLEVHYNQALEDQQIVRVGQTLLGGAPAGAVRIDDTSASETVNLVLGNVIELNGCTTLTTAYATPIGGHRQFEGEFRFIFNRYFGR